MIYLLIIPYSLFFQTKKTHQKEGEFSLWKPDYLSIFFHGSTQSTILTRASITANIAATQNPLTVNHGTNLATNSTIRTLMIRETRPRVRISIGRVRTFRNGPIVLLTIASTTATMIAVRYPSTVTPGIKYAAIATAIAEMRRFISTVIYKIGLMII